VLRAAAVFVQEAVVSRMISGIVARYMSLAAMVESRVNLYEQSMEVHKQYIDEYHQCREMISGEIQRLQQIRSGSRDSIVAARQWMDQLKVIRCFYISRAE